MAAALIVLPLTAHSQRVTAPNQLTDKQILDQALIVAERSGDPHPDSIRYVRSTRGPANQVMADAMMDSSQQDTPVVLVVMTGHFIVDISHPYGVNPDPHYRQLEMIWADPSGEGLDSGLRPDVHPLELSSLGPVHQLLP
ncbi:MAG TPA: hypothetical protein VHC49_14205 [Mycobacteriales bacterium]|nr:hypothetical protein [Mycobacteriales bacterium]